MKDIDVLIFGAGPAGLTAGIYAARAGAKTVIIEPEMHGGQMNLTPDVANFPGFKLIGGSELGEKMCEQAVGCGVEIAYEEIKSFDLETKRVKTNENEYRARAIVLATGCGPRRLGLEREDGFIGAGVHFCGLCDGALYAGKNLIVVGGGNSAAEEVIYLSNIAKSVVMVTNTGELMAQKKLIEEIPRNTKIIYNAKITEILGDKKITGLRVSGEVLECDGIFVAVGRMPNTDKFLKILKSTKNGYLIVDGNMKTSIDGVYAAGDIIDKPMRQIITACADGAIAGTNAARATKGETKKWN